MSLDAKGMTRDDTYLDGGLVVFTSYYHLKRGACCGSGCRHCPYDADGRPRSEILARFPEFGQSRHLAGDDAGGHE